MKTPIKLFSALAILILFFLTSCASTKVTSEWKDPNFSSQKFKNIMVLGLAKQPRDRKLYEDKFVRQLKGKGIMATASYTLITQENMRDKATIVQTIKSVGFDGVIITRVRDIKEKQRGGVHRTMYEYHEDHFTFVASGSYDAGTVTRKQKFNFESKLYDVKTKKPVFSLSSKTIAQDNIRKRLDSYISIVVNKMIENNLL